jgi:ribonuclease BN (tRNA processing enzyme)
MKVRVLGCSGGIGGRHLRTTAFLVDHDILIDGGTGVGDLSLAELALVDHVFVTHSHLDHVACIPLLVDTVSDRRSRSITLHGSEATLTILRNHIFNWSIWPDFSEIPSANQPLLIYHALEVGETVEIGGRRITALPANHTVPALGYHLDSGMASLVFTGDTTSSPELWEAVNEIADLRYLIIETAFSNRERQLAVMSKHLCPSLLGEELARLQKNPEIFVTHLKPGQVELTMAELEENIGDFKPRMLQNNHVFEF